ncbi:MAG: putative lipid II flippase FtsW [Actinomycetota bacterium]|nr:putative lipid II flippase FtsW [Actinomycetota bacterium]
MATRAVAVTSERHLQVVRERGAARSRARLWERIRHRERTRNPTVVLVLLGATGLLTGIGLVMVLSASSVSSYARYHSSFLFFKRQAVYVVVGTAMLLLTARIRYRTWQRLAIPLMLGSLGLLVVVLHPAVGTVAGGSSRWIAFGPVTVQPSEIAKLAMVVFTATILTRKWNRLADPLHAALPLLPAVAIVCGLIMLQPDLGTTVIVAATVFVVAFVAGIRLRYLVTSVLVSGILATAAIMANGYMKARFLSFLHPWKDPTNTGYQLIQSLIGLGSGGWLGVGLGASRQKWMYIPNAHTDFIFSILGEELGLLGEIVVLILFGMLIYAGIRVAARAPDTFGRLLAAGIVGWLGLQTLVNLGAVTGLLPVTGVPLPFVSFGGSSLVVTLAAVGILVNIGRSSPEQAVAPPPKRAPGKRSGSAPAKRSPSRKAAAR